MQKSKIKAIFFDVSNVILSENFREGVKEYEVSNNLPMGKLFEAVHGHQHWKDFTAGEISEDEYFDSVKKNYQSDLNVTQLIDCILSQARPNQELIDYITGLKGRYRLGLISNTPGKWLKRNLQKFELENIFDVIAVSSELHVRKPDRKIFEWALNEASVDAKEAIYADDREEMTGGATELGINVITYKNTKLFKKELEKYL